MIKPIFKLLTALTSVFITLAFTNIKSSKGETSTEKEAKKPIKKAVIVYGDEVLFSNLGKTNDAKVQDYYESLKQVPGTSKELLNQIELYLSVKTLSKPEIRNLIDSLLELGDVNYPLINRINQFLLSEEYKNEIEGFSYLYTESTYPASFFYESWNTTKPNPYSANLYKNDSKIRLKLSKGTALSYKSPVDKIVVTSHFGNRWGKSHRGIDLDLEVWDEVKSAFAGKVRFVGNYGGYGRVIVIRHYNGLETLYAHLHRYKVKIGDEVKAGSLIGLGGSSGNSSGSHLHFEIRFKGIALNPEQIIDFKSKKTVSNKITLAKNSYGYSVLPDGIEFYTVQKGDYLVKIANQYGVSCLELCKINGINRNAPLRIGQKIRIL